MQGLLSSAHIVAAFYMHSTTIHCNNCLKTILHARLGSINGRAFFKRLDPEKVSIVKAWSFQAIRFIRTVSPSASARPLMPLLLRRCHQSQKGTAGCRKKQTKIRFQVTKKFMASTPLTPRPIAVGDSGHLGKYVVQSGTR